MTFPKTSINEFFSQDAEDKQMCSTFLSILHVAARENKTTQQKGTLKEHVILWKVQSTVPRHSAYCKQCKHAI